MGNFPGSSVTTSPDTESSVIVPLYLRHTCVIDDNNNGNGSCNDAKNESLNKKIENELQEIHKDVNIDQMCRDIWKHRRSKSKENDNGSFSSIGDIDIFKFGFVSSAQGKKWQGRESVVIEVLKKIVEHENNGGLTA